MTTTHTFQGLNADGKPSSRVLNPPGGSTSNIFGSDEPPRQQAPPRNNSASQNNDVQGPNAAPGSHQKPRAPRSAFNPITGEPYDQPKPAPNAAAASASKTAGNESDTLNEEESPVAVDQGNPDVEKTIEEKPGVAATVQSQATQQKKQQQQSGVFGGGAEEVKEHRSTRVSQPPGGRSSKLW